MRPSKWALPRPGVHRQGRLEVEVGEEPNPEHGVRKDCHSHTRGALGRKTKRLLLRSSNTDFLFCVIPTDGIFISKPP